MEMRHAVPDDLAAITQLLVDANLPTMGLAENIETFFVAETDDNLIGVVGLEIYASVALLRSLAVSSLHQRKGLGTGLCDYAESEAASLGVTELFLLTESAEAFFTRRGYAKVPRDDAPADIQATDEYSCICPESASFMRLTF